VSALAARVASGWDAGFGVGARVTLGAASVAYRGALAARGVLYRTRIIRARALACPVIAIGNLTVGGTGKTPAVELAVRALAELGHRPAVVSRGYGRRSRGVHVVADVASIRLEPDEAGDEPFLLARRLPGVPVVVGADRWSAGRAAVETCGATALVLDDGFQQRTLATTLDVVMARARRPWGNGRLLPAGPLREPLGALARAHAIIATDVDGLDDAPDVDAAARAYAPGTPVLLARLHAVDCWDARRMDSIPLSRLSGAKVIAFAGIASPAGFAATLRSLAVDAELVPFPDHHWYSPDDLRTLQARAARADALVTTEKDWVRLRGRLGAGPPVYVVSVALRLVRGADRWRALFERCRPA